MRIIILLSLLFATINLSAQGLDDIKYDSIVKIENTDLSLVYSKKKTAVWHDANFFVAKPTKNYFIFLEAAQLLVEVDFKHNAFYAIVQDDVTGGYKRFFLANDSFEADVFKTEYEGSFLVMDSVTYNFSLTEIESTNYATSIGEIGLQLNNHFLYITDFKYSFQDKFYEFPLMSIEYPGEDSISNEGGYVYPDAEIFPGVQNTGVYNIKEKNWLIKPCYFQLIKYQNKILVSTELDPNKITYDSASFYTLYQLNKDKSFIVKNKITENNKEVVSLMTSYDSIQPVYNKTHYITYKNGSQGLIEYQLFNFYLRGSVLHYTFEHLSPEYEFLYYSASQSSVILLKNNIYKVFYYEFENDTDRETINIRYEGSKNKFIEHYDKWNEETDFINSIGYREINDSLLIITDFVSEYHDGYPLITEYGEDSMLVNKNGEWDLVYSAPKSGKYHCGLYNLNQKKWIIKPNEYDIKYFGGAHIMVEKPIFNERQIIQSVDHKSIYSLNGELIISNQTTEEIVSHQAKLEKVLLQEDETLEPYHIGQFSNKNIPDSLINSPYYYKITKGDKEKVLTLNDTKLSGITSNSSEYHNLIFHDPKSKFNFYLDNNKTSLSFSILEDSIEMKQFESEDYEIEIYTVLDYEYLLSSLAIIRTDKDSVFYEFGVESEEEKLADILTDYKSRTKRMIIISKIKNEIIYSVNNTKGSYHIYGEDYEDYGESAEDFTHDWEQEYTAIYRKTNKSWHKVSPSFNTITKVPFGYICKTGEYNYKHSLYFGDEVVEQKIILASYILLDSTLKPIGYSDFYNFDLIEDLGFGLKICLVVDEDKWNSSEGYGNCFFVDYKGNPFCDAIYDGFEVEDGQIYGIKNEVNKIDEEYGDEVWDYDTGEPILLQEYERELIGEIEE